MNTSQSHNDIAALISREQIRDLVHRYSDAVTRYDREVWVDTWCADATWDVSKGRMFAGRDAIEAFWHSAMSGLELVVQTVQNGAAELLGENQATGRWHITEHFQRSNGERSVLLAWYDDQYTCESGTWRFASRRLTRLYHGPADLSGGFLRPPGTGWDSEPLNS
jgi:hypothetical protein